MKTKLSFLRSPFSVLLIAAAMVFAGCNKNDDNTDPDNGGNGSLSSGLSIDKTTIDAAYTAGTYPLQVTATQAWSAEVNAASTWCTVTPDSYAGNHAVTVSVAENPTAGVQRAATITFTSGTLTRTVGVTQAAIAPVLTATSTALDATAGAASYSIGVTSNTDWTATVSAGATWCTLAGTPGNGNGTVTVNVAANAATVTRTATVTLAAGTLTRAVGVTQAALTTPPNAFSTQTWVFGDQTWSDAIHIPACNKASFTNSYTDPVCRSYTESGKTWYYYNWAYVDANKASMCPDPWRVPTKTDFINLDKAFPGGTGDNRYNVAQSWITANYITSWGGVYGGLAYSTSVSNTGSYAYYWSSTQYNSDNAYYLYFDTSGLVHPQYSYNKYYGFQVRCVK